MLQRTSTGPEEEEKEEEMERRRKRRWRIARCADCPSLLPLRVSRSFRVQLGPELSQGRDKRRSLVPPRDTYINNRLAHSCPSLFLSLRSQAARAFPMRVSSFSKWEIQGLLFFPLINLKSAAPRASHRNRIQIGDANFDYSGVLACRVLAGYD